METSNTKIQQFKIKVHNDTQRLADLIVDAQINLMMHKKTTSQLIDDLQDIVAHLKNLSADAANI